MGKDGWIMTLDEMERAIDENANHKSMVLAFPPKPGWDLTIGAQDIILQGLSGRVLFVKPPLVYFEVSVIEAKRWYLHVRASLG